MRDQIINTAEIFGGLTGRDRRSVSYLVFGRSTKLDDIIGGGDLSTRIFERAMQWFSDRWPEGVDWPVGAYRPAPETLGTEQ